MTATLLRPEYRWECPNCDVTAVTHEPRPHSEMHQCRGAAGMVVPMITAGTKAKVELVERGDMIGDDKVQLSAEGRPIMAAITTRDDGQDCTVYAPCATATLEEVR